MREKVVHTERQALPSSQLRDAQPQTRLSPKMSEALAFAHEHGGLVRWTGGFWTYPGCEAREVRTWPLGEKIPVWYVALGTVRALVDRGLLEEVPTALKYLTRVRLPQVTTPSTQDGQGPVDHAQADIAKSGMNP